MVHLISVILPFYNRSNVLPLAIHSILCQSYRHWELVLVNDCSTDNSLEVARSFSDSKIKILQTPQNSGAAAARNLGIKAAKGEFISFLDSDDTYHPRFLELSVQALAGSNDSIGYSYTGVGDMAGVSAELTELKIWRISERYNDKKKPLLYDLKIGTAAGITMKRSVFERVGYFDEALRAAEDTDFFIRVSEHFQGWPIDKILIFKDNTLPDRLTLNYFKNADAYDRIIAKNKIEIAENKYLQHRWYYKGMWLHFYANNKGAATRYFFRLIKGGGITCKVIAAYLSGIVLTASAFRKLHRGRAS
jgi:glycosyltransferase involved in cell wall biosynthesis